MENVIFGRIIRTQWVDVALLHIATSHKFFYDK